MKTLAFALTLYLVTSVVERAVAQVDPATIPDSRYVQVKNGHLEREGKRVRFWGLIGYVRGYDKDRALPTDDAATRAAKLKKARANIDLMVERIPQMGFNLIRNWDGEDLAQGENPASFEQGDGSVADLRAYYLWRLDQKGIAVWESSFNRIGNISAEDVGVIDEPASAEAWAAAMRESGPVRLRENVARAWDERTEAMALRRMKRFADFRNPYKNNLRWGDDPQVVTWELSNEEIWIRRMTKGDWQKLPRYFQEKLIGRWNGFLRDKYGDEAALKAKWVGLLPGESLAQGTVQFLPMQGQSAALAGLNDTNPEAVAKMQGAGQKWGRDDFARARGEDVLEFLTAMWVNYKKTEEAEIEKWGKSCRLAPTILDSYNPYQIQENYLHQQGDVSATCTYIKGMGHDSTDALFPFYSGLKEYPRMAWDAPWLEQSKIPGKPLFVYETQIDNRTKYRAEYPYRMAAALSLLDGDIVNWHDYGTFEADASQPRPFDDKLHVWSDHFHYAGDEVQISAMRAAAQAFLNFHIAPAPAPTTFVYGRKSLYDPASMDYGGSFGAIGRAMMPTAFRYGTNVIVDPTRETDEIRGPIVKLGIYQPNPVVPNRNVEYDWHRGHLKLDAPGAMAYVGFWASTGGVVRFENGLQIRKVTIENPPNMPFPVRDDEQYVAISVATEDGLPLAQSKRATLSAVSTSFNTGYGLNLEKPWTQNRQGKPGPLKEFFGAQETRTGEKPVLVARVGAVLEGAALNGFRYTLRDWNMDVIESGVIEGNQLVLSAKQPVFFVELSR